MGMRLSKIAVGLIGFLVLTIQGCGGGGGGTSGGGATTKTATIIFTSQDTVTPSQTLGGFDLTLDLSALPAGAQIATDSTGLAPLASAVFLSGAFASATLNTYTVNTYDSTSRVLTVKYPGTDSYALGQFLTVKVTVPISYTPNLADINGHYTTTFYDPFNGIQGGNVLSSVTASVTFN